MCSALISSFLFSPQHSLVAAGTNIRGNSRLSKRLANVLRILATEVSCWLVIADGKVLGSSTVRNTAIAVHSRTSDRSSIVPDNLGEVTIVLEVSTGVRETVLAVIGVDLAVVEAVGDGLPDVRGLAAGLDVLAVSAAVHLGVVGELAALGDLLGGGGEAGVPGESGRRVVGAVHVVAVEDLLLVVGAAGGGGAAGAGGGWLGGGDGGGALLGLGHGRRDAAGPALLVAVVRGSG